MLTKKVQMIFLNSSNKKVTINVDSPAADADEVKIKSVMQLIIDKGVIGSKTGNLEKIDSAKIVSNDVTEINMQ